MKHLSNYIAESMQHFLVSKKAADVEYHYHPKTYEELMDIIERLVRERGYDANLNDVDTSQISSMIGLFSVDRRIYSSTGTAMHLFNGDISLWDVSNVKQFNKMFYGSKFNGDISEWNMASAEDISSMFRDAKFDGDISGWKLPKLKRADYAFQNSDFNGDLSAWTISKDIRVGDMLNGSLLKDDKKRYPKRV